MRGALLLKRLVVDKVFISSNPSSSLLPASPGVKYPEIDPRTLSWCGNHMVIKAIPDIPLENY